MQLTDVDTAINEVAMYRDAGGGAIVEATTIGIGRAPEALVRISRATGVHVVMGAGFYVDAVHPEDMAQRTVEDLAREISDRHHGGRRRQRHPRRGSSARWAAPGR